MSGYVDHGWRHASKRLGGTDPVADDPMIRFHIKIDGEATTLTTGDGKRIIALEDDLNGMVLVAAEAYVTTVSSSGTPTIQIRNVTDSVDMLTTKITIDASEFTSYTAATRSVVDTSNDDVSTGDRIAVDCDVAGTGAKGLGVHLTFGPP